MELDSKDTTILNHLRKDAKLTTQQLSRKTNIPISTVHNRIRKMEGLGIIKGYTVVPDFEKLGLKLCAFSLITFDFDKAKKAGLTQKAIAKKIKESADVEEAYLITGDEDILVRIRVQDVHQLSEDVTQRLRDIPGVQKVKTMLVLDEV